ncbi:aspartate aminotransferase family protein [Sporomusaceae bacterium FL31]|nr:aspartate aminotransferase family protein [Sporomusaceae bacterium FL31]GCE32347.1 aspartate aminotransferase family protein [Sporomusaceae bacterium]
MTSYIGPDEILQKKRDYLIPCVYHFYKQPMQLVRGEMQYLYDQTGKQYLDCFAGVSVVNCGHCNPEITKAICEQVTTLQHTTTIYLTQNIVNLAERLASVTPGSLQKSFFCASGTEANEGAALLASIYTGKHEFISLRQGLHGRTKLTMSLTGLSFWRTDTTPVGGISFAPNAYCYRCPMHKRYPECDLACANEIETVIKTATSGQVAAMIAEPIQGNGGMITPPPGYFKRVKEILDHYGILLIIDEVQTGFGRTGKMFAIEHYGVEPDIMTMAKALANGTPVGAFIARAEVADKYTRPGASTLGGNPVTAAAGLATLDVISKQNLPDRAAELGLYLKKGLKQLQEKHPIIGDVRGLGLMLGAELVLPDHEPAISEVDMILEKMKDRGFLVGKNGPNRNVLAFQPPLIITQSDLDHLLNNLDDVLSSL